MRGGIFTPPRNAVLFGALILAVALDLIAPAARADQAVLWLKTEWPPVFMANGGGFGDHVAGWLSERLPGYRHETRSLPLARLLKTMEQTDTIICASGLARTPAREAQFIVSHDLMRMPGLALVVRAADLDDFSALRNSDGTIAMRRLLGQADLDGAIHESRSYGHALDEVLRSAPPTVPLSRLSKTASMLSMLAVKRVDWLLLYPFEATWQARQGNIDTPVVSLPVADVPATIRGGITCNRAMGSAALVAKIDHLIAAQPEQPWLRPMMDWLDPEARKRLSALP